MTSSVPFELGFPGEHWRWELNALSIPVPEAVIETVVLVAREGSKFVLYTQRNGIVDTDSALMAAALVHEILESYLHGNAG